MWSFRLLVLVLELALAFLLGYQGPDQVSRAQSQARGRVRDIQESSKTQCSLIRSLDLGVMVMRILERSARTCTGRSSRAKRSWETKSDTQITVNKGKDRKRNS